MTTTHLIPLAAARGDELRAWLAPLAPADFVHDYWARKPLFIKGFRDKYQGFFDAETFSRALSAEGPNPDDFLRVSFDRKTDAGTSAAVSIAGNLRSSAFRAPVEAAVPLFDAGATLCVSQIETRVPALVPFLAAIKRQLGFAGKVSFNAYLSPPGAGFNWHFDARIASSMQIEGSKRWRFSNHAALVWPRANGSLRADGTPQYTDPNVSAQSWEHLAPPDESHVDEVLLEPGDLLILPAGVWHEACGEGGGSLALNLSFTPVSYSHVVRQLLDALLTSEAEWRCPPPLVSGDIPGQADAAGLAAIGAALERAAGVLASLRGDSAPVVRVWQSLVAGPAANGARSPLDAAGRPSVAPEDRLRVADRARVYALLADGGSRLCVTLGSGRTIELTGAALPFVQRMLGESEFTAADCTAWTIDGPPFGWPDVAELLTDLAREGLVERVATR